MHEFNTKRHNMPTVLPVWLTALRTNVLLYFLIIWQVKAFKVFNCMYLYVFYVTNQPHRS